MRHRTRTLHAISEYEIALQERRAERIDKVLHYVAWFLLSGVIASGIYFLA